MTSLPVFVLVRLGIGLVFALLLVRRFQGLISSIVIRCIPLKRRLAADGYLLQNRLSIGVSVLLIGLITFFFNKGITTLATQVGWITPIQLSSTNLMIPEVQPIQPQPIIPNQPSHATFGFLSKRDTMIPPMPQPIMQPRVVQPYVPATEPHYIQLVATGNYEKALNLQREWAGKTAYRCYVASLGSDATPFKVLLGPFPNAASANYFIRRNRAIKGFPRKGVGLQFIH